MKRKIIKIGPPGTIFERSIAVPDLSGDFYKSIESFPLRAAELWAQVMEGSVRTATVDFSWRDPADPEGKKILTGSRAIPNGFLDGGQTLADKIEALARKIIDTKILPAEDGADALDALDALSAEAEKFLTENPGTGVGASWVFTLETPFAERKAKIAEVPLPGARDFLAALFDDMTKIIETVDINLSAVRHPGAHQLFLQDILAKIYGQAQPGIVAAPAPLPGLPGP